MALYEKVAMDIVAKRQQDEERDRSIEVCTRYYVELSPELRPYIEAASRSRLKESMVTKLGRAFKFSGEIRPTDIAAVIAPGPGGEKSVYPMVWGYHVPGIDHPIVNARSESVGEKKTFSGDWRKHRCIIPASYYFEWEHIRKPDGSKQTGSRYAIQPARSNVTYLAGLYRIEEKGEFRYPVFTVLTREPSEELRRIHDRMPLILPEELMDSWICPDSDPEFIAEQAITVMICESA